MAIWHHRGQRSAREAALRKFAEAGLLSDMLALVEDVPARKAAVAAAAAASSDLRRIESELALLDADTLVRETTIRASGEEIAKAIGLVVLVGSVVVRVLS
jgi:septum formation inhibitor MinC